MRTIKTFYFLFLIPIFLISCTQENNRVIDLSGTWTVKLDPENKGAEKAWYNEDFDDLLQLPGCLQEYGYGEKPGPETKWWTKLDLSQRHPSLEKYAQADTNFKLVQFLMPRHHYIGAAWYSREIEIPESFKGKQISLKLERCHWESSVWLDGQVLGKNRSLATAHVYDLSQFKPGKHKLSIRIDNGEIVPLGQMPHSISDQTAGTWNGIVGDISLEARNKIHFKDVQVYTDIHKKSAKLVLSIANPKGTKGNLKITADASGYNNNNQDDPEGIETEIVLNGKTPQIIEMEYPLGEQAKLWDEFDPNLYQLHLGLQTENGLTDNTSTSFGLREITQKEGYFFVNGIKTFMRGNVDCAVYPKTGYAPMTVNEWKRVFKVHKDFGLNHVRYHSWCPPEAAFAAADELGMYLAPEVHEWASINKPEQLQYLKEESAEMLRVFGNHASFVMMAMGNESGIEQDYAEDLIHQWKSSDDRRLYSIKISAGWNMGLPEAMDFEVLSNVRTGDDRDRIRTRYQAFWPPLPKNSDLIVKAPQTTIDWREGINFYFNKFKKRPLLAHETAQFCSYPDIYNEMKKYTGYLRPTYLEIAAEQLEEHGMTDQLNDFVKNSGLWAVELTREEIEATFRTPNYAGFQWLALNDFTGQNTAPVGFTDAFYEPKSFVDGMDMRDFCGPTVLLGRLEKRVFTTDETFKVRFEVSHFGKDSLHLKDLTIAVRGQHEQLIHLQAVDSKSFSQGSTQHLCEFEIPLNDFKAPSKNMVEIVSVENGISNSYDFWIYPNEKAMTFPKDIKVRHQWNGETLKQLKNGETVLLLPEIGTLKGNLPSCFTTYYWTSFGEQGGQSSACGITTECFQPLFNDFPTDTYSNWQWWDLLTQCQPMILDQYQEKHPWPKSYRPLIQLIDTWKLNRKLALVVEAKIGKGKLLICSMDIEKDLNERIVARQFRKSLINYLQSKDFDPKTEVSVSTVSALFDQSKPEIKANMQGLPTDG